MTGSLRYEEPGLVAELRNWWEEQVGADDPFAPPKPITETIYDLQPEIDSLAVVTCLVIIEKHLGFEVSPAVIRRGGYRSFDDMVADLLSKTRALARKQQKVKTIA